MSDNCVGAGNRQVDELSGKEILIEGGAIFCGSVEQFRDCFFDNATKESITSWCTDNDYELSIESSIR